MGCFVEIALPKTIHAEAAFSAAFSRIALIQKLLSFHDVSSELSRLNHAQGQTIICHPLSIKCFRLAQAISRVSDERFNFTLGAALVARRLLPVHNYNEIYGDHLLDCGNWRDLELTSTSARLVRPVLLILDGIAKGFAVDSAIAEIKRCGVDQGWINAGGDLRVFGDVILPIAIRDHRGRENMMGGLQNAALATSTSTATTDFPGILLDKRGNELAPMTSSVIARSAWRADALTKVAAATKSDERAGFLATLGGRWIPV